MKKLLFSVSLCCLLAVTSVASAASGGIKSNRNNECAIWLCLPGGFPGGCGAAHAAMISRITDFAPHHKRRYSTLPSFGNCVDDEKDLGIPGVVQSSQMTYTETPTAVVPAHRECTRIETVNDGSYDGPKRKCVAWKSVPEQRFEGQICSLRRWFDSPDYVYDDYGQIIDSLSKPKYCKSTVYRVKIFGDGIQYGNYFDYKD